MERYTRRQVMPSAIVVGLALLALLLLPQASYGGGLAVILDRQPTDVEAGKAFTVGFVVRSAHEDRTPITGLRPRVELARFDTDEQVTAAAEPDTTPGHYVASIVLPSAGQWRWTITPLGAASSEFRSTQPPLTVHAPGAAAPAVAAPPAGPVQAARALDAVSGSSFEPRALTIAAGTTVRWSNAGTLVHTVTAKDGTFASGAIEPGKMFEHTFAEPGSYAYYCDYHGSAAGQGQYGTITVTAAQAAETTGSVASQVSSETAQQTTTQQLPATGTPARLIGALATLALCLLGLGLALARRRLHTS